jgi:acetyltransferase
MQASHDPTRFGQPTPKTGLCDQEVVVGELRAGDAPACEGFIRHLEQRDLRMRFASAHLSIRHLLPGRIGAHERLTFGAFDGAGVVLGIANLVYLNPKVGEVAIIVRSDRKRLGIARSLLAHLLQGAGKAGLSRLIGYVLAENSEMLALADSVGCRRIKRDGLFIVIERAVSSRSD